MPRASPPRHRFYGSKTVYPTVARELAARRAHVGDDVARLESELRRFTGAGHAVAVPQARVGLYLLVKALVRQDDAVLLSPYTIADVVNMVLAAGARPCFVDVEEQTCNIDAAEVERALAEEERVGAVLVTHLHGLVCDVEHIGAACRARGVPLLEDSAQAFGARVSGKRAGTFGRAGVYSFGRAKNVNALYGGAVVTDDDDLASALRLVLEGMPLFDEELLLRRALECLAFDVATRAPCFDLVTLPLVRWAVERDVRALTKRFKTEGDPVLRDALPREWARRMSPLQARLALPQLATVDEHAAERRGYARLYHEGLAALASVERPPFHDDERHVYLSYPIQLDDRRALELAMLEAGRDVTPQHIRNTADAPCFSAAYRACPRARRVAERVLLLPTWPGYGAEQVARNVDVIRAHLCGRAR